MKRRKSNRCVRKDIYEDANHSDIIVLFITSRGKRRETRTHAGICVSIILQLGLSYVRTCKRVRWSYRRKNDDDGDCI